MPKVVFPCDLDHWWIVKDKLHQLKEECLHKDDLNVRDIAEAHQIIVDNVQGIFIKKEVNLGDTVYFGLVKYFRKHATAEERTQFVKVTFPSIIDLGLEVERLLPTDGIDISEQQNGGTTVINRSLCCSIVACGFLCLFPCDDRRGRGAKLNLINFNKFFANLPIPSQNSKLQCILHFFDRVASERNLMSGSILFTRQVVKHEELPTLDTWLNCSSKLCDLIVLEDGLIEDAGFHTVEVDFANCSIGGGVLSRGRVQEEIRFTVCPELIVSMLFMEVMEKNEAIVIQGYEQFSAVQGYAADLRYVGDYRDGAETDEHGNLKNMLCAIDAVSYRHDNNTGRQYKDQSVLRDLNKAFTGFCTPFTVPADVCGRSLSVESYVTAKESEDGDTVNDEDYSLYSQKIDIFVDKLLHRAINLAIADASKTVTGREERHEAPHGVGEHYLHRQSSMDHLEVNFRDWYANYRRRSSNLSDLSSRRSSYDCASRRSSACSARGYSSEYSSEFEEYYDNFQQQEQRYKYHTITEEVGSSVIVNEFASSLAASLLRQGAEEASGFAPQVFHGRQPNYGIQRPLPVRISTGSLSTVDSVENEEAIVREDCIRQYVDKMFENVWPFYEKEPESENQLQSCIELKQRILGEWNENNCNVEDTSYDENQRSEEQEDTKHENEIGECQKGDDVNDIDETLLIAVADRLVSIAFQEALLEYRYIMCNLENNTAHCISSFSESSQSDHSIDSKDQSDLSAVESTQSEVRKNMNLNLDPALMVADKVLSGLFSNKESAKFLNLTQQSSAFQNQSNIPNPEICDTNLRVVDSTSPRAHSRSSSSDDNELSASRRRELYSRVADNILFSGLTTRIDSEEKLTHNDIVSSSLNVSSDSSQSDGSVGRQVLSVSPARCDYKEQSSHFKSRSPTKLGGLRKGSSSSESKSLDSKSSDAAVKGTGTEVRKPASLSPRKRQASSNNLDRRSVPVLINQKSTDSTERSKMLDTMLPIHKEGASYDGSYVGLTSYSGSKSLAVTKGSKLHHMTAHQARLALKPGRYFVTGNKKNYDQFANSLSRDLLTNAFLQVQEHNEPVAYPRRSSEPMQISNGAALQRYEHSFHTVNGRRSQKSKTDEDIAQFDDDWMQQFNSRSSSGFRDPILSRFAEELMKANVSVPELQLMVAGDIVSISSSSHSVCSTISSFRDPLLASFEEELLNSADKRSAKTHTSWSKVRGSMCSPRPSGNSTSSGSREDKKQLGVSMSVDSEVSWISNRSNNALFIKNVSDYAETLSRRITCEALTIIYWSSSTYGESDQENLPISVKLYSDMLAASILKSAVLTARVMDVDLADQNKVVTWSEETECVHYSDKDSVAASDLDTCRDRVASCSESGLSSGDYEDALDIPYKRLEEFADVLASKVLINSVAITRREYMCSLRRQYGRPIATGNWGCGAFGGDPHLKSLIQWMAASYAGCPSMLYYTFRNPQMSRLKDVVSIVQERGWDVSKLMQVVRRYCIIAENEVRENGYISRELFDIILQGEIFPGV